MGLVLAMTELFFWSNNLTSFTPPHHQNTETPLEEQLNVLCLWMSLVKTSLNGMSHGTSVTQWSANNWPCIL